MTVFDYVLLILWLIWFLHVFYSVGTHPIPQLIEFKPVFYWIFFGVPLLIIYRVWG